MMQRADIVVRQAAPADCVRLSEISAQAFSQPMTTSEFERELSLSFSHTLLVQADGKTVGFVNVWSVYGEADLNNIAVDSAFRRMGLGQALLDAALELCHGCGSITLEVRASNSAAIAFYEKNGFTPLGRRKDFYEKPTEDALIYQKSL